MCQHVNYVEKVYKMMLKTFFPLNFKKQPAGLKGLMWSEKHNHHTHDDKCCFIFGSNWICLDEKCKHVRHEALVQALSHTLTAHPWRDGCI